METHFLADKVEGTPTFRADPWYNPYGDCIVYQIADEAVIADRVDELLTVYRSAIDNRPIGFQIKGVAGMIRKLGLDGLTVSSEADAHGGKSISVTALLLAAYEEHPPTVGRRMAYAAAVDAADRRTMPANELDLQAA